MKFKPISITQYETLKSFNTYNELINDFTNKYLMSVDTLMNINEMEQYLIRSLNYSFPKISINLSITSDNNAINIVYHNNFMKELKKFYPESLF